MIGIHSAGIRRIPALGHFLPQAFCPLSLSRQPAAGLSAVAVWGHRPTAVRPVAWAARHGLPVLRLEDGFIRSLGLGVSGEPPLSMVVDTLGIYYDARQTSTLEQLIQERSTDPALMDAARQAMAFIVEQDISKYNQAPPFNGRAPENGAVLVVDQTFGDMAVTFGQAGEDHFTAMLQAAMDEHPEAEIWVKIHPDVLSGKKRGYLGKQALYAAAHDKRVKLLAQDVSPQSLLRQVTEVYAVTSQYGFEALLAGKRVHCFGQPWYAGWGVTHDRHPEAAALHARRGTATLSDLFAAAYLRYSRYIDPLSGKPATLQTVLYWLMAARQFRDSRPGTLFVPGLSLWKKSILHPFLHSRNAPVRYRAPTPRGTACVVWGVKGERRWQPAADRAGLPVWRMEDGFLRSSGLGSDLYPPLSLVLDTCGIYYDATRPSDLETSLITRPVTPAQQQRARALRTRLVAAKVSKYNLGAPFALPPEAVGKRVLLVPGQVEDDASIATGALGIATNQALLETVRARNPDAFIIYKPHPDVLAGNRRGHIAPRLMASLADQVAEDADIIDCIHACDELHTLTSLAGFEALLHGKTVFCYGMPFYAGWGLTHDALSLARRTARLSLDALVYHTLISYPTYIHPRRRQPMSAEQAITTIEMMPRADMSMGNKKFSTLRRHCRKALMLIKVKFSLF
ncbi:capsular polysaccharide biosynthesis protein [Chimaeribacter arupi]|uniref:capsular polysaccharide biosynthesis protein n=1 Tax=Chimaeribacter arupi TaxID=2060066 RepID=UPI000C7DF85F|nr:capsular polysaccharide biosynthesis protein [Chimaeribacter arupi]MDV5142431.1 capsular polysaccharide biosynthesis protein [Chimaeribacter arupi]PLR35337.1 beta-3-deoxy-D-manno-oct-2-ulosonic acid transferase [Chimaeribacter arupi]